MAPKPILASTNLGLLLLLSLTPPAPAATFQGDVTRFSPTNGQAIFPAGNLNVFKQYVVGFDVAERVGKTTRVNLLLDTVEFGGELSAGVRANFGIEVGLSFGGNADFDLAFKPTVTLPDQYPYEVALPLTISEGLLPDSRFTTSFPPLGKAYADLILDLDARLKATACVFGCFDALNFDFSTCDIPPLFPSGVRLFNPSLRCDPALTAKQYCSIELASFNRHNDSKLRLINVKATNSLDFLTKPYLEYAAVVATNFPVGAGTNGPLAGRYGTLSMSAPTVETDSRRSTSDPLEKSFTVVPASDVLLVPGLPGFRNGQKVGVYSLGKLPKGLSSSCIYYVINSVVGVNLQLATQPGGPPVDITDFGTGTHRIFRAESSSTAAVLKSSGAGNVMGIGINVAEMAKDFIFPPPTPQLSDSGSVGALSWDYTLAALDIGPAVQLQTEFEMTWHLEVTEITFRAPGTTNARPVKINGQTVSNLTQVTPTQIYYLSNRGSNALPLVTLLTTNPVQVDISYVLKPDLKTVVSTPFIGRIKYKVLGAGASIDRVGELRFGPLIEGEQKFMAGEFTVFNGAPSPINSGAPRTEYGSTRDLDRYDLRLISTNSISAVPGAGGAVVIVSKIVSDLYIRIFDPSGDKVVDGLATSLLAPATVTVLTTLLTPFPFDESSLSSVQRAAVLQDATSLVGYNPGHLTFQMQASGPASFDWRPDQLGNTNSSWTAEFGSVDPKTTNWRELLSTLASSYPGKGGSTSSHAQVTNGLPHPILTNSETIATLKVGTNRQLTITQPTGESAPKLTVGGGLLENSGTINVTGNPGGSSLSLNSSNAVLCGPGAVRLTGGGMLEGYTGTGSSTFGNFNTISGAGSAMDQYFGNPGSSTINNMGTFRADIGGGELFTSAKLILNQGPSNRSRVPVVPSTATSSTASPAAASRRMDRTQTHS